MTVEYLPSRTTLWRWALIRTFWFPRRRWGRIATGPGLAALGALMIGGAGPFAAAGWGLLGGSLLGTGVVWTLWPFFGAFAAVTRSGAVRNRQVVRLTVIGHVLELVRGEDRVLFALDDLVAVRRVFGEQVATFTHDRAVLVPRTTRSGDPTALRALLEARLAAP